MLRLKQKSWNDIVDWYFEVPKKDKRFSLQLYPFYREDNRDVLKSDDFYDYIIKKGYFIQIDEIVEISDNFTQRKDGSFRTTQLLSPILFLILETIGLEIFRAYEPNIKNPIEVYYAGNYEHKSVHYRDNYNKFYKRIKELSRSFDSYIKLDIQNFFLSINVNILFNKIAQGNSKFKEVDYFLMREFLLFLGNGKFPVVENSTALSYLATEIYLENIDLLFSEKLGQQTWVKDWKAVRFVDDLYIFYNGEHTDNSSNIWELIKTYADIIFHYDLEVNMNKVSYNSTELIEKDVKNTSFPNNHSTDEKTHKSSEKFTEFLKTIYILRRETEINTQYYYQIMEETLIDEKEELTSLELFHNFLYDKELDNYFQQREVNMYISGMNDVQFISNDIRRLTALILKSDKENNSKNLLANLFAKSRSSAWTRHDVAIANSYLLQRNVEHHDLLEEVKKYDIKLYNYYRNFCRKTYSSNCWATSIIKSQKNSIEKRLNISVRTEQLYFLYLKSEKLNDTLLAYAYFKSYFDRRTAELHGYICKKPPNYKAFFEKSEMAKFYSSITDSHDILTEAHSKRNSIPSIHGKAELLALDSSHKDLLKIIKKLKRLLIDKQEEILLNK